MEQASERVMRWKAAWESRDVDAIVAMYHPNATHESSLVPRFYPEAGGTALRGTNQIRTYFANALGRFTELRFELVSVTESSAESSARAAIEYRRHSNVDGANPAHVLELVQWEGPLIKAVRVFHF
jgi:ketosteroid isomerase-like protein